MNLDIESLLSEIEDSLKDLIGIQTVEDLDSRGVNAPFGKGVRAGFDYIIELAKSEGLIVKDIDGYAVHVEYGHGDDIVAMLCHMDTVGIFSPESWRTDPYQLTKENGRWYGRGVNDNKGPLIGCLYLLIAMKRLNVKTKKRIRLIIGGAEETSWRGIKHYLKYEKMPTFGISPDGNFPIVNNEKGVRYYSISGRETNSKIASIETKGDISLVCDQATVLFKDKEELIIKGRSAPSRHPSKGENAILKMINSIDVDLNIFDEILNLVSQYTTEGMTTNVSSFNYSGNQWTLNFDIRWEKDLLVSSLDAWVGENFLDSLNIHVDKKSKDRHFVPENALIIQYLKEAYKKVMGEDAQLLTKGGASYARAIENGIAFGPCFEGDVTNNHLPNESQSIDGLLKALAIYWEFLLKCEAVYET